MIEALRRGDQVVLAGGLVGKVTRVKDENEAEVEEDTEAFLEKVFSGLDSDESQQPQEEGYGLLRRRRLGALRDLSNDS